MTAVKFKDIYPLCMECGIIIYEVNSEGSEEETFNSLFGDSPTEKEWDDMATYYADYIVQELWAGEEYGMNHISFVLTEPNYS